MDALSILIRWVRPTFSDLGLPEYASEGAVGVDLKAAIDEAITLEPLERQLIPSGIAIALPDGYEAQVRPRSGLALKKGITVLNAPGTVDSDYRGEIGVILVNLGAQPASIGRGDRIAQLVIAKTSRAEWKATESLPATTRNGGGFGSTGK